MAQQHILISCQFAAGPFREVSLPLAYGHSGNDRLADQSVPQSAHMGINWQIGWPNGQVIDSNEASKLSRNQHTFAPLLPLIVDFRQPAATSLIIAG